MVVESPDPPPRQRNARGQGDRLREQLIEATVRLLEEHGAADRVSVRAIARAAGVSPTALYLHFPDRDALVEAAVDRSFDVFNAALRQASIDHGDPRERLAAMGRAYLEFAMTQPALYAVLFTTRRTIDDDDCDDHGGERDEALDGLLDAVAAVEPDAAPDAVRARALTLWSALHGYATLRDRSAVGNWPEPAAFVAGLSPD